MPVCTHCATPLPDGSLYCSQCGTPVPGRKPEDPTFSPQGREIFERLKAATEDKYEIIRELGRGGMAVVFLGFQKSLDRQVAIKVLLPLLGYDPEIVERFMREARTQGKLDHPNIIQVYEIYNEGGLTFFTVPYISGESLRVYLRDCPQPPLERVFRYLTQAADALAYAHRRGVVHRDVKPDNILIDTERDRVILTDFGIAKALTAEKTLTTPGDLLGTPQYMSPEQGEGRQDLDGRADQYSLGLIGYEMLAGERPIRADNLAELMYKHRFEEPPSLDEVRPEAPRHLREAIHRAIRKDRDERFPTMDAFLAALEGPWGVELAEEEEEGRTEPMPPPGSEATTVRVPTPPRTPRPVPVGETTPETAEPEEEPEPTVTTPEPWAAAAEEPTLKTPEPTPVPAVEPPVDTSDPWSVSGTQPWEAPAAAQAEAVPEAGLLGEARRPGVPRALLYGGGAAVVAIVAALFIFGPLKPDTGAAPQESVVSEETGVSVAGGQETPEPAEATTGEAAPGGEALAEVSPPGGDQTAPAETGTDEVAVEPAGAEPGPVEGTPAGTAAARPRAEEARRLASTARQSAIAAGVGNLFGDRLDGFNRQYEEAERLYMNEQYGDALTVYSDLILAYRGLEDEAGREAGEAAEAAAEAAAQQARARASTERQAAVNAGAATLLSSDLDRLDSGLQGAEQALEQGRFDDAAAAFQLLAGEYETLAGRATDAWQTRLRRVRSEMLQQRGSALAVGAEEREPDRLAAADRTRDQAAQRAQRSQYAEAQRLFEGARDAYALLAAELVAAQQAEAAALEAEPAAAEEPPEPLAETVILDLVNAFIQAFEQEDMGRMAGELYKGDVPGRDRDLLDAWFRRADDMNLEVVERNLQVDGSRATVDLQLRIEARQARTGERAAVDERFRLEFEAERGVWRLTRTRRR
ncbi:MAG: protein kinase [Gemmatimonadota bacterium]|nr:MAG: protein kinase [Gemmatimonadota bacterium]